MADEIEALAEMVKQATTEELSENIGIEELRNAANSFLIAYEQLEKTYELQRISQLKSLISNTDDPSGNSTLMMLIKTNNLKAFYTRTKYLLAFSFDETLTRFREQAPRYAAYVYIDPKGVPHTFKMSLKEMIALLDKRGRIGNPKDSFFIRREYATLEEEQLKENANQQNHNKIAQTAYQGTVNRLNRYYDVFGLTGSFRQGGRLLWLESAGKWAVARVNNGGDLKEAYVAALMVQHQESTDSLCYDDVGVAPYYSHSLIRDFFNNYIYNVTNMAAIREEDVITSNGQYAVKGSKASAPSFNQYLTIAKAILTENIFDKESLEEYIEQTWQADVHRNVVEQIIENTGNDVIDEIAKQLKNK